MTCASLLSVAPLQAQAECALEGTAREWIQTALDDWDIASRDDLELERARLPWIAFIDTTCAWHVSADANGDAELAGALAAAGPPLRFEGQAVEVRGIAHGGQVRLPGGQQVPAAPLSFAGPLGDAGAFLVIGMPPVWLRDPNHAGDPDLGWLVRAVFVHEMTHTRQLGPMYRRIDALAARVPDPDNLNDDVIQTRFDSVPDFRPSVEHERDLLYAVVNEADLAVRRRMVAEALDVAAARQTRWLGGEHGAYAQLEEVFLDMEGVAQWAAYRSALRQAGPGADTPAMLARFRRGGHSWSQDLGLALFLAADRIAPGWQARVLGPEQASIRQVLADALR